MYKLKFQDLNFISNKKFNNKLKKLFIIPGLGCEAKEYNFILKNQKLPYHSIIIELPGHNNTNCTLKGDYLENLASKIFLFLFRNNYRKVTFYCHSMSSLIVLIMFRSFLRRKVKLKKLIINEGNLVLSDASIVTEKTVSYTLNFFKKEGFENLINKFKVSKNISTQNWSDALEKISPTVFYRYSQSIYKWSKNKNILSYYKNFFKKKIYLYGEKSKNLILLKRLFGERKFCISSADHFSHIFQRKKLINMLTRLLLERDFG